jgi:hypothetical protein
MMPTTTIDNSRHGPEIVSGYDFAWTLQLAQRGTAVVATGATIEAALVSMDRSETLIAATACSSSAPDADWSKGLVTIEFPAASTEPLAARDGEARIELSVTLAGKRTHFETLATIHTGRIPS